MTFMTKTAIVLLCFSLCGAGGFIASGPHKGSEPQKANAIPVKNHEVTGRFWIVC